MKQKKEQISDHTRKLSNILRSCREREGLSLRELASISGVSFATLSRIERLAGDPDPETLVRILNWLGEDAAAVGFECKTVAQVHFRASKNLDSDAIRALVAFADSLRKKYEGE